MADNLAKRTNEGSVESTRRRRAVYRPEVDIYETDEGIVLLADMPGVDEKNVEVNIEDDVLTIRGHACVGEPEEGYDCVVREYRPGDYERSFAVGEDVDYDRVEASIRDGVLKVFLPKTEKVRPRKIKVKAG